MSGLSTATYNKDAMHALKIRARRVYQWSRILAQKNPSHEADRDTMEKLGRAILDALKEAMFISHNYPGIPIPRILLSADRVFQSEKVSITGVKTISANDDKILTFPNYPEDDPGMSTLEEAMHPPEFDVGKLDFWYTRKAARVDEAVRDVPPEPPSSPPVALSQIVKSTSKETTSHAATSITAPPKMSHSTSRESKTAKWVQGQGNLKSKSSAQQIESGPKTRSRAKVTPSNVAPENTNKASSSAANAGSAKIPGGEDVSMNVDPGEPGSADGSSGIVESEDENEESDMDMDYDDAEDDWMNVLHGMRQSINNDRDALNKKVDEAIELLERIVAHRVARKTAMKNRK